MKENTYLTNAVREELKTDPYIDGIMNITAKINSIHPYYEDYDLSKKLNDGLDGIPLSERSNIISDVTKKKVIATPDFILEKQEPIFERIKKQEKKTQSGFIPSEVESKKSIEFVPDVKKITLVKDPYYLQYQGNTILSKGAILDDGKRKIQAFSLFKNMGSSNYEMNPKVVIDAMIPSKVKLNEEFTEEFNIPRDCLIVEGMIQTCNPAQKSFNLIPLKYKGNYKITPPSDIEEDLKKVGLSFSGYDRERNDAVVVDKYGYTRKKGETCIGETGEECFLTWKGNGVTLVSEKRRTLKEIEDTPTIKEKVVEVNLENVEISIEGRSKETFESLNSILNLFKVSFGEYWQTSPLTKLKK